MRRRDKRCGKLRVGESRGVGEGNNNIKQPLDWPQVHLHGDLAIKFQHKTR
jgi:hypothetical protein